MKSKQSDRAYSSAFHKPLAPILRFATDITVVLPFIRLVDREIAGSMPSSQEGNPSLLILVYAS